MAIASLAVAIVVALVVLYRDVIHALVFKPRLKIKFGLEEPISRETTVEWPVGPSAAVRKKAFWPRLRIKNKGLSVARKCEGILAEVRHPDGSLNTRYDPLKLRWAIAPIEKGLEPLDIARHRIVDLNTFTPIEGEKNAPFATYPDPIGIPLFLEPGHYWLRIVIYGDNFKPVERGYAVHWDGKDYRQGLAIKEMNDKPSSTNAWPWEIIE